MKRAGLDYHEFSSVKTHKNFQAFLDAASFGNLYAIETCGTTRYSDAVFEENDAFVFGSETKGLSEKILAHFTKENILKIPMQAGNRSLNLSNSVAVVVYEAWRQRGFGG